MNNLGALLKARGKLDEAEALSVVLWRAGKRLGPDHSDTLIR